VPAAHLVHAVAAAELVNEPAAHAVHLGVPSPVLRYLPAAQSEQPRAAFELTPVWAPEPAS